MNSCPAPAHLDLAVSDAFIAPYAGRIRLHENGRPAEAQQDHRMRRSG